MNAKNVILATLMTMTVFGEAIAQEEDFSLESLLDAPVSAASKYEQTAREAPASVTVVTAQDIEDFGYRTIAEALQHVRGFYLNDDLDAQYIGMRGFGKPGEYNNRVLVLVNGQSQNEATSGYVAVDERLALDLDLVERIEVVRGPGSSLYGSGAMFSVVNVVTKDPGDLDRSRVSALRSGDGLVDGRGWVAHEFENGLKVRGSALWGDDPGTVVYFEEYDDPQTNDGVADHQNWRKYQSVGGEASYGGLALRLRSLGFDHGNAATHKSALFNSDNNFNVYTGKTAELEYSANLRSDMRLNLVGSRNRWGRKTSREFVLGTQPMFVLTDDAVSTWYRSDAQIQWDTSPANRLSVGAQYSRSWIDYLSWVDGEAEVEDRFTSQSTGLYLQNEFWASHRLAITLGGRFDHYQNVGGMLSPRFAVVFNSTARQTFKLLYGSAVRVPNAEEVFAEEERISLFRNPQLKPERIHTVEGIWEQEWTRGLTSAFTVFHYTLIDLIELEYNEELEGLQRQNLGGVNADGAEFEVNRRFANAGKAYGSYAFQLAKDHNGNDTWSAPRHQVKAGYARTLGSWASLAMQIRFEAGRRTRFDTTTKPAALTDLTFTTRDLVGPIGFTVRVRNLFDLDYGLPGTINHRQRELTQPGRTVSVRVAYAL